MYFVTKSGLFSPDLVLVLVFMLAQNLELIFINLFFWCYYSTNLSGASVHTGCPLLETNLAKGLVMVDN